MSKKDSHHAHLVFDKNKWDEMQQNKKDEGFRTMAAYLMSCHNRNVERKQSNIGGQIEKFFLNKAE